MRSDMEKNKTRSLQQKITKKSLWQKPWFYIVLIVALILTAIGLYQIPAIGDRAYYYVASARARVQYFFHPPAEASFNPQGQGTLLPEVVATLTAMAPTATPTLQPSPTPTAMPTEAPTITPTITSTPTPTPTPIPTAKVLKGVKQEMQKFNNCGPTNLAMLLSYWGWEGDQTVTAAVLKPRREDRNVMPYEMLDYVNAHTEFTGVVRYGGNIDLVKKLVAAGYPVLIERGYINAKEGWMGHYGIITGYDDAKQRVNIPDSYLGDITMSYDEISRYWDQFDNIYLVVYPYDKTEEVARILGPQWDKDYNLRFALEQTTARIDHLEGMDLFFAWYSRGSILVELQDYAGAAKSYDQAFAIYDQLPTDQRPWRVFWYQTGPYFAYFNTARYQDVLDLANYVLDITPEDAIPETWVWRGRANKMLENWDTAVNDFKTALVWHPDWWVAENELAAMGVTP